MTVTLTFDPVLSRVQIAATGLGAATSALVESSTDQIRWTTVRGGTAVPASGGVILVPLSDYEFIPGQLTYYRVSGVTAAAMSFVAAGAVASGNNASITPALPAGIAVGDLLVIQASIRNSGAGTVNVPAGWTVMVQSGNVSLLGRRYLTGDVAPLVTFAGGVTNADTIARMFAFRNADLIPVTSASQLNGSAQNVAYPLVPVTAAPAVVIVALWKADDWTSIAAIAGMTEVADNPVTAGDDAAQSLDYVLQATVGSVPAGTATVTGGIAAISRAAAVSVTRAQWLMQQTSSITPAPPSGCGTSGIWLRSVARPFLSMAVQVINSASVVVTRPARTTTFAIVGRTLPIAVSAIRQSRRWTMTVRTELDADATRFDLLMASGDVLFVQVPVGCSVPGGYVSVGDVQRTNHPLRPNLVTWQLPITEIAPPGPDVVGALGTWQTVINSYATWADVIAAKATWADLLALVGSPSEVIVP